MASAPLNNAWAHDRSIIEAASWRLASELVRRHPKETRLFRGHPGGGTYDVLWILGLKDSALDIRLNRNGTIQVHGRVDNEPVREIETMQWADYLMADPKTFLLQLEHAVGWTAPATTPRSTPETLTYRVLAALAAIGTKTIRPISIEQGYIDSSGYDGGRHPGLNEFSFPDELTHVRDDDFFHKPGYRFWMPYREGKPLVAIEQSTATVWFTNRPDSLQLMSLYKRLHKEPALVAAEILKKSLA